MAGELNIDQSTVDSEAANVSGAAGHFTAESLSSKDEASTIHANDLCTAAFQEAQQLNGSLGTVMDQEAANIRSLGVSFVEFDQMMGELIQKGQ